MSIASSRRMARLLLLIGLLVSSGLGGARPRDVGQPLPILEGHTWRYFKGTSEPPAGWASIAFDDGAWLAGQSGFGYGDGDDATVLADMQNGYLAVYTRKLFEVQDPGRIAGLELRVDWDDGFVAYINGQEVARRNLAGTPGTPVAVDIPASSHEAGTPESIAISTALLVAGTNVLAVQVHNVRLDSSDLTLIAELRTTNPPPMVPSGPIPADGTMGAPLAVDLCVTAADPNDPSLTVTFHGRPLPDTPTEPFTIIALPDTQYYSESYPATYAAQTQWIVDNRVARNIAFVTQLGDVVNVGATEQQWINADAAWDRLEDPLATGLAHGIPYGIAVGNHDQSPIGDPGPLADEGSTTPLYNQTFGVSRFAGRSYHGGHYGASNDNHYELFSAGGLDFVAIHMEYMPADTPLRQAVLAWADQVLRDHASRRAIVTVHYLINPSDASWSNQGQATWDALKGNHNLFLMLSGHLDQAHRRYDEFTDATGTTRTHTLVSDYQSRSNGGNGWLRILTFSPDTSTIEVETFSPTLGVLIDGHADNTAGQPQNRFTLSYDMPGGGPFEVVGSAAVASGSQACARWGGLASGTSYEWYAVVSDGATSTTGERSVFTTTSTCVLPSDCDDADPCTTDDCVASSCVNDPMPGCCASAADCDDGDPCTDDVCAAGACQNPDNTAPCDDGDGCTVDDVCAVGVCAGLPATCDDSNACTIDACANGVCASTYAPTAGCCATSDDCDDGDVCSADACSPLGDCTNTPAANCCDSAADCDDGEECTTDTCEPVTAGALSFDGVNDYVTMGPAAGTDELGATTFTVETWFYWTGGGVGASTGTGGIAAAIPLVSKGAGQAETPANVNMNYLLGIAGGRLVADFEDAATGLNHPVCTAASEPAITPNAWHHAAAVYDGTCWALYVDGMARAIDTACSSCSGGACTVCPGALPESTSIQHFGLGTSLTSTGTPAGYFQGRLDEVRVWNIPRTTTQIQAGRFREVEPEAGLIGSFHLDDGAAGPGSTSAADASGRGNPGTLVGGGSWSTAELQDLGSPGVCGHAPLGDAAPECCLTDAECDDADPCTSDSCGAENRCASVPVPGCTSCTTDPECDDANVCTSETCDTANDGALSFDGIDDFVTMGVAPGLGASVFTVEAWFAWTGSGDTLSTGTGGLGTTIPLVAKGRGEADGSNRDTNYYFGLVNGRLAGDFEDAATGLNHPVCTAASQPVITTNAWHHAAAVYDGTCWTLYLDGVAQPIDTACSSCSGAACTVCPGATPRADSIQHFAIGAALQSSLSSTPVARDGAFAGRIDEVRVWNVARSGSEIVAGMGHEIPTAPGLIGRFSLSEGAGLSAFDSTSPPEDGTLCGGAAGVTCTGTNVPTWSAANHAPLGDDLCDYTPRDLGRSTCGIGACERTVDNCVDGQPQVCVPGEPVVEICDGLDNDCDTTTDEDAPAEVTGVRWTALPRVMEWEAQAGGLVFDVVGDTLAALRTNGVASATCLANGLPAAQYDDTRPEPAAGEGHYYLIRSRGGQCAPGTWGYDSFGAERFPSAPCP